jgi:hypothetical protein
VASRPGSEEWFADISDLNSSWFIYEGTSISGGGGGEQTIVDRVMMADGRCGFNFPAQVCAFISSRDRDRDRDDVMK